MTERIGKPLAALDERRLEEESCCIQKDVEVPVQPSGSGSLGSTNDSLKV